MNSRLPAGAASCLMTLWLGACAGAPIAPTPPAPPAPAAAATTATAPAPASSTAAMAPAAPDAWAELTRHFVMDNCNAAPRVRAWLNIYSRSPAHFERSLRQSLPLLRYVQDQLLAAGIPGEFALLPLLESGYRPALPAHRGGPAGMWQFMPGTARVYGLQVNPNYDGRRDPVASTHAAIAMLQELVQQFSDWRLVDMAYNMGPEALRRALRRHPTIGAGAFPNLRTNATTTDHLAKLMALSCIVSDSRRFGIELPQLQAADTLATVKVPAGTGLRQVARWSGVTLSSLRQLNPGYRSTTVPAASARSLLLPARAARMLAAALTRGANDKLASDPSTPTATRADATAARTRRAE